LKQIHGFTTLSYTKDGDDWLVDAAMSPGKKVRVNAKPPAPLPSKVTWDAPDPRRGGNKMVANPLTKEIYNTGSAVPAGGVNPIFRQKVGPQQLKRGGTRLYVEGHLLNKKLGGPGDEAKNLTPLSYSANINHWLAAEGDLQDLMKNEPDPMAYYEVKVNYPNAPRKIVPPITSAECELADSITVKWQRLKRKKGTTKDTVKDGSMTTTTVDNVPPYPHA